MWELYCKESWALKNPFFWTVVLRRLLRVPWTTRRSNQSILKISPECSLEGLMLKLELQYFGHLMRRTDILEKTLMLGKNEDGRKRGQQRRRWLDGCREPAQAIPPMTRSCGRDLISKASGLEGLPRPAWASTPKPESVYLTILCLSPTLLTLTGGYPVR